MATEPPKRLKWLAKITEASSSFGNDDDHFILIVLNSSLYHTLSRDQFKSVKGPAGTASDLEQNTPMLLWLWQHSTYRIAADGAANSLKFYSEHFDGVALIPDVICGDMDSVTPETLEYFKAKQVPVITDDDQDKNDLFKALDNAKEYQTHHGQVCYQLYRGLFIAFMTTGRSLLQSDVFVYGGFGGRLDQQMQSLNSLYIWNSSFLSLCLVSEESQAALIPVGQNQLEIASSIEGPICGIVPLGIQKASVTTNGLKWNLHDSITSFGGLISSSNEVIPTNGGIVEVSSDAALLWTVEVHAENVRKLLSYADLGGDRQ